MNWSVQIVISENASVSLRIEWRQVLLDLLSTWGRSMIRHRAQKAIDVIISSSCIVVADRRIINNVVIDETRDLQS